MIIYMGMWRSRRGVWMRRGCVFVLSLSFVVCSCVCLFGDKLLRCMARCVYVAAQETRHEVKQWILLNGFMYHNHLYLAADRSLDAQIEVC